MYISCKRRNALFGSLLEKNKFYNNITNEYIALLTSVTESHKFQVIKLIPGS